MSRQHNYIKYFAIILFILILFSPFTFAQGILVSYYQSSVSAATYSGPGYNQQWQIAGKWVRENTPNNAVFAHWWDYGYWVQSGFQRATVTDGGNFFGWWNYLMGRNVLTAQTNEEPLKFLKAHSVTHVLVVPDEIGKYPAYSSIGSDHNADRYSYIPTFNLNQDFVRKTRNSTILVYTGGFGLDTDINYNGRILPRNSAVIIGIEVPLRETEVAGQVQQVLLQPTAIIAYQNQRYDLKLKCIYLDKLYMYENFEVDGCFRIMPVLVDQNRALNYGAGLYLSKTVANGFVGRMYLLDQQSENFNLVYNDNASGIPLAIYQGRIIGPFKIWEVKYPNSLTLTQEEIEYFTTTSYPDSSLLKPL